MEHSYLLAGPVLLAGWAAYTKYRKSANDRLPLPPLVDIPPEDIFSRPREAYGEALAAHGPVIRVRRKGNLEYIVNQEYARYVLTCNRLFSFEDGAIHIMNLQPIMVFTEGTLFQDLNTFVREAIVDRIDENVYRIWPLFQRDATKFLEHAAEGKKTGQHPVFFDHFHQTIAETTLLLLFGKDYISHRNLQAMEDASNAMAELTGQYQNFSIVGKYLPILFIAYIWIKVVLVIIPFRYLCTFGPQVWPDINRYEKMIASGNTAPEDEPRTVLFHIVKTYTLQSGGKRIGWFRRLYIHVMLLCMIFAAVHTSTVVSQWVLCRLAEYPEYLGPLREEILRVLEEDETGQMRLTAKSLREARLMDSFLREVMRLKGDTIASMRLTTTDVPLGNVVVPKGSLVTVMATTVHENPDTFGDDPREFKGFQWAESNKEAVMTGPGHIAFGLGRFACPGRVLAVNEIKLIVLSLIARATPTLLEGKYEVSDPLNTVTQPPKGTLVFEPLEKPYL
ncbi:cytochrome P450 [Trametes elegans]|nr:cytochrome P450 [Trametes elegans]